MSPTSPPSGEPTSVESLRNSVAPVEANEMADGKIAGIVLAVLLILLFVAAAVFVKQNGMPSLSGPKKLADNQANIVVGLLALSLLFAFCGLVSRTMIVVSGGMDVDIGIFTTSTSYEGAGHTTSTSVDTCELFDSDRYGPEDSPCRTSITSRCAAAKAFSVIGFLANTAVVAVLALQKFGVIGGSKLPELAVPATALGVSFCYMLVYAIWADFYNSNTSAETTLCGFAAYQSDDTAFGGAFALWVIASLITGCVGVAILVAGGAPDQPPVYKNAGDNATSNEAYSEKASAALKDNEI